MAFVSDVSLVFPSNQTRAQLSHGLDGRYGPMDPGELAPLIDTLTSAIDTTGVDYVLGFDEGGVVPAFAFAQAVGRKLVVSTRLRMAMPNAIVFEEPHSGLGTMHYLHGLEAGDRVVIIEDEVTTGRTVVNATRALRNRGLEVIAVGALLVVNDPAMWSFLGAEAIVLHAAALLPADLADRLERSARR